MLSNKEIVEKFYGEYFRSPRINEFEACGGDMKQIYRIYGDKISRISGYCVIFVKK